VSSRHLRRWLVATTVVIVGVIVTGAGRSGSSAIAQTTGLPESATVEADAWGLSGPHGIMPIQPRAEAAPAYERGVRVKVPVPVGAVAAALLTAAVVNRIGFLRQRRSRLPFALRAWSLRRRAPPLLALG
jgi:hypothetical protein